MADLRCSLWGWEDTIGLTMMEQRIRFFAPGNIAAELLAADVPAPIAAAEAGWRSLPGRSPALSSLARLLHDQPGLITGPLTALPSTCLHGDWKMGNLGTHPDGRTILIDWAYPGSGPACWDLCWYLALNRARLPESKEAAIGRFRAAIEAYRIATASWWDAQLDLCLIAIMATFYWGKHSATTANSPGGKAGSPKPPTGRTSRSQKPHHDRRPPRGCQPTAGPRRHAGLPPDRPRARRGRPAGSPGAWRQA
jgi:Phosphotransferase enzyme family